MIYAKFFFSSSLWKGRQLLTVSTITPTIKLPSGNVVPILDISPKQVYQIFLQQKQIIKQVLKYRYWLGKGLHFGLSLHFGHKDQGISLQNFELYTLYKRET